MLPTGRTLRKLVTAAALTLVAMLASTTQAYAASATVYNPMKLSNTTGSTYPNHAVYYFSGWTNRFAIDINSSGEYADMPIYLWGADWSTAHVLSGSNAPVGWNNYYWNGGVCTLLTDGSGNPLKEYAMAFGLDLSNGGQTAGFAISHLSNYHYAAGAQVSQNTYVANLSYLSNGRDLYSASDCNANSLTSTAPHIHVESARQGTTSGNGWDQGSCPSCTGYPSWYYVYP